MDKQDAPKEFKASSFWDHLDELRGVLIKIVVGVVAAGIIAFFFKEELFSAILAPKESGFITYRLFESIELFFSSEKESFVSSVEPFSISLVNIELAQQFMIHVKMSMCIGFLVVFPYLLYELFHFVSPALYTHERQYASRVICSGYLLFMAGVALSYFLIFPITLRFLGTYQVSSEVENIISLSSYISTLLLLSFMMGILFEIPILCWLFAKLGLITATFMRTYRRHAIVILLIVAAFITPTSDIFTLLLVATPIYLLYEASIYIVSTMHHS